MSGTSSLGLGVHIGLFNMDIETQATSLRELARLNTPTYVFTMYYGVSENYQAAFADFRQRMRFNFKLERS